MPVTSRIGARRGFGGGGFLWTSDPQSAPVLGRGEVWGGISGPRICVDQIAQSP